MSDLVEVLARQCCEQDDVNPNASLGGDGQNFLWMEYAETRVKPLLATILNHVESNLSAVQYDPAPYTAMKARLSKMRKEAGA